MQLLILERDFANDFWKIQEVDLTPFCKILPKKIYHPVDDLIMFDDNLSLIIGAENIINTGEIAELLRNRHPNVETENTIPTITILYRYNTMNLMLGIKAHFEL